MVAGEVGAKLLLVLVLNNRSDGVGDGDGGGGELLIVVAIVVCFSALSLLSEEASHTKNKNHNQSFFVNQMKCEIDNIKRQFSRQQMFCCSRKRDTVSWAP